VTLAEVIRRRKTLSHPEEYDVVVLGSGAPGKLLAWTAGLAGEAPGGDRATVCRRVLPPTSPASRAKKRDPRRQGRQLFPQGRRVSGSPPSTGRSRCPPSATASGKMVDGLVALHQQKVPGERRGARHGPRTLRRAEDLLRSRSTRAGPGTLRGQTVVIDTGSRAPDR